MTQEEKAAVERVRFLIEELEVSGYADISGVDEVYLRVLLAMVERDQWQPIETAPKDEVLLYFPEIVKGSFGQSRLAAMMKVGRVADFPFRQPTHWRLPQPPEAR
ncbi:hypothetical protein CLG96_01925 [Sphingomonas oleivorans]|uniref:Uncharacterized protein n=1 Tax=Sphingomonas oleivorans TaxID=1735121 RepID=A0A2T5G196_9SPHN|nr:hypothetical protein [Sphingomonas oleivorans]PTQ12924.1 hypothetical protein CLG96_01925 [Sphingomonas oleivorans]